MRDPVPERRSPTDLLTLRSDPPYRPPVDKALPAFHEYIMGGGPRALGLAIRAFGSELVIGAAGAYAFYWGGAAIPSFYTAAYDTLACAPYVAAGTRGPDEFVS